jgi:acetyl esterase/lipase
MVMLRINRQLLPAIFLILASTTGRAGNTIARSMALARRSANSSYSVEVYGHPVDDPGCALHWAVFAPDQNTWGSGPYPVCLLIHGGKFQSGTPTDSPEQDQAALDMAAAGYLALSIEYREAGSQPLPGQTTTGQYDQQPTDCEMALNAALADPRCNGKVVVIGGSAGATHAAMLCDSWNTSNKPLAAVLLSPATKFDDRTEVGYESLSEFISAIQIYTNTNDSSGGLSTQLADSPVSFVTSASKPMFIVFSINDEMPYTQLGDFTSALNSAGVTNYEQTTLGGSGHAWDNWASVKTSAIAFLNAAVADTPLPQVNITRPNSTTVSITWSSVPGKIYQLESAPTPHGTYTPIGNRITASDATSTESVTATTPAFYLVRVVP